MKKFIAVAAIALLGVSFVCSGLISKGDLKTSAGVSLKVGSVPVMVAGGSGDISRPHNSSIGPDFEKVMN